MLVAGEESTDGRGGVVPSMIAEHKELPALPSLITAELDEAPAPGEVGVEGGVMTLPAALPAVISVNDELPRRDF